MTVEIVLILISFLASLKGFFIPDTPLYLRLFSPFLLLTISVEMAAIYLIKTDGTNTLLYNIFMLITFVFYFYVIRSIIKSAFIKRLFFLFIIGFLFVGFLNLAFIQGAQTFNSMTYSIGTLAIVAGCAYYFYELFQLPYAVNLLTEPGFWICTGLLFFFVCAFPFFGLVNFLSKASVETMSKFGFVLQGVNLLLYSLFTTAFLCRSRVQKSL